MLSTKHNFLFIHIPKTGGNSIQRVLLPLSDDCMALTGPHHDGIDRFEIRSSKLDIHKHSTLEDYRRQISHDSFSRLFKFACVRNPWDRCVSFFFSPHRGRVEWSLTAFSDFIERSVRPQSDYLRLTGQDEDPFDNIDYILRFEKLSENFFDLCSKIGIKSHTLPVHNKSNHEDYRFYYKSNEVIELVYNKFNEEIKRFKFEF
ncbi:sulfotransferase family 2 domain-containing protein [Aquabacter spiritensis]|uniref:sulfotransferase family 2 domain-containing protein n=1 Tax=Aquabacter spiritensis TaxID=933073 RepID=UPI001046E25B